MGLSGGKRISTIFLAVLIHNAEVSRTPADTDRQTDRRTERRTDLINQHRAFSL